MPEITVLDAAFIIATVAFFRERLGWVDSHALLAAFIVTLVVGLSPVVAAMLPALSTLLLTAIALIKLFLLAAGGFDAIRSFARTAATGK